MHLIAMSFMFLHLRLKHVNGAAIRRTLSSIDVLILESVVSIFVAVIWVSDGELKA